MARCGKKRKIHISTILKLAFIMKLCWTPSAARKIAPLTNGTPQVRTRTTISPRIRGKRRLIVVRLTINQGRESYTALVRDDAALSTGPRIRRIPTRSKAGHGTTNPNEEQFG